MFWLCKFVIGLVLLGADLFDHAFDKLAIIEKGISEDNDDCVLDKLANDDSCKVVLGLHGKSSLDNTK